MICDEIDLCDVDFYRRALALLESGEAEMVVGSKVMKGANDDRPLFRHVATLVLNGMLRVAVGFRGTDTHGLKAFRRDALVETAEHCVVDKDLFASEVRGARRREGKKVVESRCASTRSASRRSTSPSACPTLLKNPPA